MSNSESCCGEVRGQRCFCLPYKDGRLITSLVLSAIAFLVSWFWWVTWIIGLAGMIMFQVLWCCRQPYGFLHAAAAVGILCALLSIGLGIYISVAWNGRKGYCGPFSMFDDAYLFDDDGVSDWCPEGFWAGIAFFCGALWCISASLLCAFVQSGRHEKFEEKHEPPVRASIVMELPAVVEPEPTLIATEEEVPVIAMAVLASEQDTTGKNP